MKNDKRMKSTRNSQSLIGSILKPVLTFLMLPAVIALTSCEEAEEVGEYDDWQSRCEAFIDSIAGVAKTNSDGQWLSLRAFNLAPTDVNGTAAAWDNEDYVYVHVSQTGTGTALPLFTDTVQVNYRGRLMPTDAHPEGYIFDQSYKGDVNPAFNIPTKFCVGGLPVGFSTALQHMHTGDLWRIYVPAKLGYGSSEQSSSGIPAYSALIFDIHLADIIHP